jgi:aminoglycoside 2'-N-acetyltransferase I
VGHALPRQRLLGQRPPGVLPVGIPEDRADLERARVRWSTTDALISAEIEAIRSILWAAFPAGDEGFTEDDWQHALGGRHFLLELDGAIVAHAAVVARELHVAGRSVRTGYVEAVATDPPRQGRGFGAKLMEAVDGYVRASFELGALGTGSHQFYERLGWETWRGPSSVRTESGSRRTPDDDGYILILRTGSSPALDLDADISCEWRPGDVW